ncbi:PREDICTED: uncharacterized protein LOC109150396 [Ipomoea nil]|uniref:uncharacterized protein LOC109150396 n=1 Tax=Ipomoea nil TaxID=35883 RepID=UPI00090201A6|nr:PREDICTED: uncharacterized protein LOC109150396 [Ipomoea nil]
MKVASKPRGRSVIPDVQNVSESTDTSVYKPQFVSAIAQDKWSTTVRRELIVQRSVDENQLNSVCDVLPLLSEVGLLKTVTSICPYSKFLTYEFYCNLNEEIDNLTGEKCQQIFIRGKCSQFTSKFVILHRIALHNWLPSAHFHTVGKTLAALLFRVGTKMTIDLGRLIFYHILTLIHPREQKGLIPMPSEVIAHSLLYTVDPRLLTGKHIRDVTPVDPPHTSKADATVEDTPYARDVQLSLRLKARVSELETVSNIISNQLNAARTELSTILLRMSLTESSAGENVKTDSEGPSNA